MPRKPARFTKADVDRALQGARSAGFEPTGYSIAPDGTIRVEFDGAPRPDAPSAFENWKAAYDARPD